MPALNRKPMSDSQVLDGKPSWDGIALVLIR
jgi:hypothetical protein